jgi:hypothetical protein
MPTGVKDERGVVGMKRGYMRMRYGHFNPLRPSVKDVDIRNIAYGLAGEYRYSSQSRLTVAQHSVVGSYYCAEPLAFLFHDSAEGLGFKDMTTVLKHSAPLAPYRKLESKALGVVYEALKISPEWYCEAVKATDRAMYVTESYTLWKRPVEKGEVLLQLTDDQRRLWPPDEAERRFLARYSELTGDRSVELVGAITQGPHTIAGLPVIEDNDATHANFLVNSKTAAAVAATLVSSAPLPERPLNSFTQAEYMRENSVSKSTATRMIEKLAASGQIRPVKFRAPRRDGAITTVCGWQLVEVKNE